MPQQSTRLTYDPFKALSPELTEAVQSRTATAPAMGIPAAAYYAYRRGIRTPLTRAGYTLTLARPDSPVYRRAMNYLLRTDPRKAIRQLKGYGLAPYWKTFVQMGGTLPQYSYWGQRGPAEYALHTGKGGEYPPPYWHARRKELQREWAASPYRWGEAVARSRAQQVGSPLEVLKRFLSGKVSAKELLEALASVVGIETEGT